MTIVECKVVGMPEVDVVELMPEKRWVKLYGKYAETWTYKCKPRYFQLPHSVQGQQSPYGVKVWMQHWWDCQHMLLIAMSRATVRERGSKTVGVWCAALDASQSLFCVCRSRRVCSRSMVRRQSATRSGSAIYVCTRRPCCCARGAASNRQWACSTMHWLRCSSTWTDGRVWTIARVGRMEVVAGHSFRCLSLRWAVVCAALMLINVKLDRSVDLCTQT